MLTRCICLPELESTSCRAPALVTLSFFHHPLEDVCSPAVLACSKHLNMNTITLTAGVILNQPCRARSSVYLFLPRHSPPFLPHGLRGYTLFTFSQLVSLCSKLNASFSPFFFQTSLERE